MSGPAKARILRTTKTTPNAGTVADLSITIGTTVTSTTIARYSGVGGPSMIRLSPAAIATTTATIPTAPSGAVSGVGWRDVTAESAEPLTYAAGTWTVRFPFQKSGQLVAIDIIIRVTCIVYEVTSAGAWVKEIGRSISANQTLAGSAVNIFSQTFTTASPTTISAGDKLQAEVVVETLTAGTPAAPAAAVDVTLRLDDSVSTLDSRFTAIPGFSVQFARAPSEVPAVLADTARRVTAVVRLPSQTQPAQVETSVRVPAYRRSVADSLGAPVDTARRVVAFVRPVAEIAPAQVDAAARLVAASRSSTEMVSLVDTTQRVVSATRLPSEVLASMVDTTVRRTTVVRSSSEPISLTDSPVRIFTGSRSVLEPVPVPTETPVRSTALVRRTSETVTLADSVTRVANYPRVVAETVVLLDSVSRVYVANRTTSDVVAGPLDSTSRLFVSQRTASDVAALPLETSVKLVTYGRTVRYQFQPGDEPLVDVTKAISGIVRTTEGAVYTAGALVVLYRSDTHVGVQTTTSAANGSYSFPRNSFDTAQYYVAAFITTPTPQQAVSERTLAAV